ncbi:MAG: histidinol-phosphatase [Treponema sp.]|nr:histidinol-phosphatase [Treponema sp.]
MTDKINLHTHSSFSDGKNTAREHVLSAIQKGFTVLGFSEHCIYPLDPAFYSAVDSNWHMTPQKYSGYIQELKALKEEFADRITILLGLEADYFNSAQYGRAVPDKKAYELFNPDFLIGSVHFISTPKGFFTVDNKLEEVQKALNSFYTDANGKIDGKAVACDYFTAEREMLRNGSFEIVGHPDLLRLRNSVLHFFDENEGWYKEQLKLTAKEMAAAGVIAEINTGAIARGLMNDVYPSEQFLEYLKEQGVPVCINSDAHKAEFLDASFDYAAVKAKRAGYKEITYPVQGKLIHIGI